MTERRRLIPIKLDGYKPLRDIVFETLREAIINQTLKPGERLMEIQLAEEMGVSRTPVREAIRKLELEGLVVMVPRKGAYVAGISMKDIHEVYELRSALEALAASLAAVRITDEELEEMERQMVREAKETEENNLQGIVSIDTTFHDLLYQAAHNQRLVQFINILQEQLQRFRSATLSRPGRSKYALEEHKKIVEALANKDAKLAAKLATEHIENAENAMIFAMDKDGFVFHENN